MHLSNAHSFLTLAGLVGFSALAACPSGCSTKAPNDASPESGGQGGQGFAGGGGAGNRQSGGQAGNGQAGNGQAGSGQAGSGQAGGGQGGHSEGGAGSSGGNTENDAGSGSGDVGRASVDRASTDTTWSQGLTEGPNGPIPLIVVDQFGYRTNAKKVAVIRAPKQGYDNTVTFAPGTAYALVDEATGKTVKQDAPVAWNGGATDPTSGDQAWWFDFSSVTTPGTYHVVDVDKKVRSVQFVIDDDVYRSVLKHAVRMFYYQRAGQKKEAVHAGADWTDDASHLGDGQDSQARSWLDQSNAATTKDLRGGWFDAGDYNKYTSWTARYVVRLLRAYDRFPTAFGDDYGIPESGNGTPDVLDETRYGLDWLVRMQNEDGSLLCVMGLGHASPPSESSDPSYYGPATTSATLSGAMTFAYAAKVFGARKEPALRTYAADLKARAVKAWTWANTNPSKLYYNNDDTKTAGSKGLAAGQQETDDAGRLATKVEAAAYLFEVTGDASYRQFFDSNYPDIIPSWGFDQWSSTQQEAILYYAALPNATSDVATTIKSQFLSGLKGNDSLWPAVTGKTDPYRAPMKDYVWGSNSSKASLGLLYLMVDAYGLDASLAPDARAAAEEFVHYIHGVNPLGLVYLTNMKRAGAENSANTMYHTWFAHGSPKWDTVTDTTPGPAPGYLVGGPNPQFAGLDGCCADGCWNVPESAYCSLNVTPPLNQPKMKAYLQYNEGWPANSWEVTEPSGGYQTAYLYLLAAFAR